MSNATVVTLTISEDAYHNLRGLLIEINRLVLSGTRAEDLLLVLLQMELLLELEELFEVPRLAA